MDCNKKCLLPPTAALEKYYKYINLAARAIYKNDFLAASIGYDSAFLYKAHPDYVDLKNYILVNSRYCLFDKNNTPIRLLMTEKKIDTTLLFFDLPKRVFSADNLVLINKLQGKLYKNKPVDNNQQKTLGRMFARYTDALDYIEHGGYSPDSMRMNNRRKDSLFYVNLTQFLTLYQETGFPTEEKIGVFYAKGQSWASMIDLLFQPFLRSEEKEQILAILETQYRLGNLPPARYASLLDYSNKYSKPPKKAFNFMQTTVVLVNGEAYRPFVYYSDSLMQVVNTNRLSIGLDSFHVVQKQVICQYFCKYASQDSSIIMMAQYPTLRKESYGFVKWVFDQEKLDLSSCKINIAKILKECNCTEKAY